MVKVRSWNLRKGITKSCGCLKQKHLEDLHIQNRIDISGEKFGHLTALSPVYLEGKRTKWICQCDCGNTCLRSLSSLQKGETSSCGCHAFDSQHNKLIDLTGEHFGDLTVIKRDLTHTDNTYWVCLCSCGKECSKASIHLRSGSATSCGCKASSSGERAIENLLKENSIPFEPQKIFNNCVFPDTNRKAKFDFFVDHRYIIEYDGQQHFQSIDYFGGEETFQRTKERDKFKDTWCHDNGIPIIRIPFTALKTLTLKDILLETTQYEVKK